MDHFIWLVTMLSASDFRRRTNTSFFQTRYSIRRPASFEPETCCTICERHAAEQTTISPNQM
jgi:hypothetical protein